MRHFIVLLRRAAIKIPGLRRLWRCRFKLLGFISSCRDAFLLVKKAAYFNNLLLFQDIPTRDINFNPQSFSKLPPRRTLSKGYYAGKPSVCFVIGTLDSGGAERQVTYLAKKFYENGHDVRVRVVHLLSHDLQYIRQLRNAGVDVKEIGTVSPMKKVLISLRRFGVPLAFFFYLPLDIRKSAIDLTAELLERPADIVHAFLDATSILAGWAGLLSGTPAIRLSSRNLNPTFFLLYKKWMKEQYQLLYQSPRIVLENNSKAGCIDYARWLGIPEEKIELSYNGIDPDFAPTLSPKEKSALRGELGIPEDALILISICRMDKEKCPFNLFNVFASLAGKFEKIYFIHVGYNALLLQKMQNMRALLPEEQRDRIKFLGIREDVPHLLAISDVLLMTSMQEGFPNVIMEAMISGVPVVATRAGGIPELVIEGKTGFLLEIGDVDGLAAKVSLLLNDPLLRFEFGQAGKEAIQKFILPATFERIYASYIKQLESLLEELSFFKPKYPAFLGPLLMNLRSAYLTWVFLEIYFSRYSIPEIDSFKNSLPDKRKLPTKLSKIVLFIGSLGAGGAERQVCLLARELKKRGLSVLVVSMNNQNELGFREKWLDEYNIAHTSLACLDIVPQIFPLGVKAIRLKKIIQLSPFSHRQLILKLSALLEMEAPDLLHCYLDEANLIGSYAGLIANVPLIRMSFRSKNPVEFLWYRNWYDQSYISFANSKQIALEANSHFAAESYRSWLNLSKLPEVIHNAVAFEEMKIPDNNHDDVRRELGIGGETPVIISVMRMSSEKRPLDVIPVMQRLLLDIPDAYLLVLGKGPLMDELKEGLKKNNLQASIRLLGEVADVYKFMAASDVLLLTSAVEGFPNVVLEAMALGLPVVATETGGTVELFTHGECGFFAPVGDICTLADSIGKILKDDQLKARMKKLGSEIVQERYSVKRLGDNVLNAYQQQYLTVYGKGAHE